MPHIVQCRICKQKFDTDLVPTARIGKQSYYHQECYIDWVQNRNNASSKGDIEFWHESVIDYLYRDVKMSIDFVKLESQWTNFLRPENKMTPKGIYFALRYFYEIQHGDPEKSQGGIGIVKMVYKDAAQYWTDLENRRAGTLEAIIKQVEERRMRPIIMIPRAMQEQKDKARFSLDDI